MWRDNYSEISKPVPDVEKFRAVINTASSVDHLANPAPDGRTTYMKAARMGTDLHLSCLQIIMEKHMEKCDLYFHNQRFHPLTKRDKCNWSLFMHAAHGGHIKTLEYVFKLHKELNVIVDKRAIDNRDVKGEAAVGFVVKNIFGGSSEAFKQHTPSKSLRSTSEFAGSSGDSNNDRDDNNAAASSLASSHPNPLQGECLSNLTRDPDNKGQSDEKKPSVGGVEEDRKLAAAAVDAPSNAAGGNHHQPSQGSQATNEISDDGSYGCDDDSYDYTTDPESYPEGRAQAKPAAGNKRKSTSPTSTSSAGSDDNGGRAKKRPSSANRQDFEDELEKQKNLAKSFEEQAKVAATQLSALQEEKDRQDRQIAALKEALASKNCKLTNVKGNLGCMKILLEGVLKECRADSVPKSSDLECLQGSLGCILHVLDTE
jgi:hypothetical protein